MLRATGGGVWLGVFVNLGAAACATSFYSLPSSTSFHAGATDFEVLICCGAAAVVVATACLINLVRRKWWALVGLALAFTPWFVSTAILRHVFAVKHFRVVE